MFMGMPDDDLRRELIAEILSRVQMAREHDPALEIDVNEGPPDAFALRRGGHLLEYRQGDKPGEIGVGKITWDPEPDRDDPHPFRVTRVSPHSDSLRITGGPEGNTVRIALEIVVTRFLEHTGGTGE